MTEIQWMDSKTKNRGASAVTFKKRKETGITSKQVTVGISPEMFFVAWQNQIDIWRQKLLDRSFKM